MSSRVPLNSIDPCRALMTPKIARSSVDLPAPFGPSTFVRPPSSTSSEIPCSTDALPYPAARRSIFSTGTSSEIGLDDARIPGHLLRRSLGDQLAEVQHVQILRQAHDKAHVVLDQQERDVARPANTPEC